MYKYLPKSELPVLIQTWMAGWAVCAPMGPPDATAFARIDEPSQALLDAIPNTIYPPKALFLPHSEVLLKAVAGRLEEVEDCSPPTLVLGIRSCDVRALSLLDRVFLGGNHIDPYWKARREKAALIGLVCSEPCQSCFCTAVGSSPFDERGADALLTDQGQAYIVKVISEKGRGLFEGLDSASAAQIDEAVQSRKAAEAAMAEPFSRKIASLEASSGKTTGTEEDSEESMPWSIRDRLNAIYESDFWSRIQQACIGCGVCTFLCPTCHCFDIVDEFQRGERVRNWDSCMFRIYSQEASGHNPRPTNLKRVRNRIMHKYAYFQDRYRALGCTGCGRCVRHCPVNIDIREIIQYALEFKAS